MIPKHIQGATHRLGAPAGWDAERDGPCAGLWVRQHGHVFASAWEPTPDEIAAINAGGSVVLHVVGVQPPVMITVEKP